jgi:hypothetical protein
MRVMNSREEIEAAITVLIGRTKAGKTPDTASIGTK